jgi:hypothetical protein
MLSDTMIASAFLLSATFGAIVWGLHHDCPTTQKEALNMKGKLVVLSVLCVLVLTAIACGGSGDDRSGGAGGQAGDVLIVNRLSEPVCFVQMSPSSDPNWGGDWLGSTEVIESGDSRSFTVPTNQGPYDIRLSACPSGERTLLEDRSVPVNTGPVVITAQ